MTNFLSEEDIVGAPKAASDGVAAPVGSGYLSELDITGAEPITKQSFLDRARYYYDRQQAKAYGEARALQPQRYGRDHMTAAAPERSFGQQALSETQAVTNMAVGLPGGVASVGMDALSRVSSLMYGDDPKTAGRKARAVADQVNMDWRKITDTLGLSRDAPGSKIEHLMNWAMEASDAGGEKLERATNGILLLETTQSVRDTLLNALGVQGLRVGVRNAVTAKKAYDQKPPASVEEAIAGSKKRIHDMQVARSIREQSFTAEGPEAVAAGVAARPGLADLPEAVIVDRTKLREIMGLETPKGPSKLSKKDQAAAAEIKTFFENALKPQKPAPAADAAITELQVAGRPASVAGLQAGIADLKAGNAALEAGIKKLRNGEPITPAETAAIKKLMVNPKEGTIKGPDGKAHFVRGRSDPSLLNTLAIMGLGAVAAKHVADWWNDGGDVSGDTIRDVSPYAAGAGLAVGVGARLARGGVVVGPSAQKGVIKDKGGMWHPKAVERLAGPLAQALGGRYIDNMRNLRQAGNDAPLEQLKALAKTQDPAYAWSTSAVTKYLNRYAGTAADPIRELRLPDGTKWEDLTDKAIVGREVVSDKNLAVSPGSSYRISAEERARQGVISADDVPGAKPGETIWKLKDKNFPSSNASTEVITSYLSHVGEFLRTLNLSPEKLQQMDLPRAIRMTVENDIRIQKLAMEEFTKPNPVRIADMEAMPLYKEYPPVQEPARQFNFHNDKSTTHKSVESAPLLAGEVKYQWRELALQKELTPEQAARVVLVKELSDSVFQEITRGKSEVGQFVALNAKGKPLKDNFGGDYATGRTPQEAFLAGRLAEEGNILGHCVGMYCGNVLSGASRILSLRDQHGRSYATVEIKPQYRTLAEINQLSLAENVKIAQEPQALKIAQIKGPGNGAPADYVQPYLQDLVRSGKWGEVKDLENAGLRKWKGRYLTKAEIDALPNAEARQWESRNLEGGVGEYGERGVARPEHLVALAAGTAAAAYFASEGSPEALQNLALTGLAVGSLKAVKGLPEKALIETYRKGGKEGEAAFATLYTDNIKQLQRSITQMGKDLPVEDIAQRTMEKLAIALNDGSFRGDAKVSTWLHRVAKNDAVDAWRAEKARPAEESTALPEYVDESGERMTPEKDLEDVEAMRPDQELENSQLRQRLDAVLEKLPPQRREIFELYELEGLDYAEIGAKLDMPVGTVKSNLSRAREELQQGMKGQRGITQQDLLFAMGGASVGFLAGGAISNLMEADRPLRNAIYGALASGVLATPGGRRILKRAVTGPSAALGLISTELGELSPLLKFAQRRHELNVLKRTEQANDAVLPFLQALKKFSKDPAIARALLNGDMQAVLAQPALAKAYPAVQRLLKGLETELQGLGRFGEGLVNYFPRMVKDFEGLKAALGQQAALGLEKTLIEAEAKMVRKQGRSMTELEQSLVVNRYLAKADETSFQPGYAKSRKLDEIPQGFEKFYEPPATSLLRYVSAAVKDIETARYFGKDLTTKKSGKKVYTDVDGSIGNLTARLMREGKLDQAGVMKLREILKARFEGGEQGMNEALATVRNLTNAGLLGNFVAAATQIGDSAFVVYHQSLLPTLQAVAEQVIGKSKIKPQQLGLINHIAEELADTGFSGKFLHGTLQLSGFKAIDMFAKNAGLNAALIRLGGEVKSAGGQARFMEKYGPAFEGGLDQVMADLRARKVTPDTEFVAFNELSDMQPISKAEVPQMFNEHPNGRLLYQLKTYMLKQLDIVRRDAWHEMRKGTPTGIARGTKNLMLLASMYALANVPGDVVKDWLSDRDSDPLSTPKLVENVIQTFGVNRYAADRLAQGKVVDTARDVVTPPWKVLEDIGAGRPEAVRYAPLVGRVYYDRFMGGNEAREMADRRAANPHILEEMKKTREDNKGKTGAQRKQLSPAAKDYLTQQRATKKAKDRKQGAQQ